MSWKMRLGFVLAVAVILAVGLLLWEQAPCWTFWGKPGWPGVKPSRCW